MTSYVLIVYGEASLRHSLAGLLSVEGHEVVETADSSEGMARVMERSPKLVIMPEGVLLGAESLLTAVRRVTKAPIIVLGEDSEIAVVKALLEGADMYLRKPVNNRELLSRVRALLRRAESEERRTS